MSNAFIRFELQSEALFTLLGRDGRKSCRRYFKSFKVTVKSAILRLVLKLIGKATDRERFQSDRAAALYESDGKDVRPRRRRVIDT